MPGRLVNWWHKTYESMSFNKRDLRLGVAQVNVSLHVPPTKIDQLSMASMHQKYVHVCPQGVPKGDLTKMTDIDDERWNKFEQQ
jgi:hypothetical protein